MILILACHFLGDLSFDFQASSVRRDFRNTEPERHLLFPNCVGLDLCTRVDERQFLRCGQVVSRPLGVARGDKGVRVAGDDDCAGTLESVTRARSPSMSTYRRCSNRSSPWRQDPSRPCSGMPAQMRG